MNYYFGIDRYSLVTMGFLSLSLMLTSCTKKEIDPSLSAGTSGSLTSSRGLSNAELKIGTTQEFENLNPLIMTMSATNYMFRMVGRTLVVLDAEGKWVPQLAKSIPSLENGEAKIVDVNGKKKIVAHWEILENAKWSDGKPVVCADFALSRKIAASPNVAIGEKETFTQVEKIEFDVQNPKKCIFTYEKARWDFARLAQFYALPSHLEEEVFNKFGSQPEGYEKNTNFTKNPTLAGLYNGPYVISEVKLGDYVAFTPNPHFYGESPKIKKVLVKLIANTGTLEANLRSGTIDMISTLGMGFDQALAFDKKVQLENLPFTVTFTPSIIYEHIDLNLDLAVLKDLRVRKALVHAIDRENLVKSLFEGKQQAAVHFVSPKDPWFVDPAKIPALRYSKREAEKLFDEAGWKLNSSDGFRYKDGKKLSLAFMTTAGNKTRELVQTYLQEQWKAAGVEVVIKNEPARVFFSETTKKRKFEGMAMYAWVSSPENNPRSTLHSLSIPSEKNSWSGQNQPGFSDKRMDAAIEAMDLEFDPKKRLELAAEMQRIYVEQVPVIPLYYRSDVSVVPKSLKNYRVPGHQFAETNEIEKWTLE
jgi:peptide/nickel transport system substrate-binding protein